MIAVNPAAAPAQPEPVSRPRDAAEPKQVRAETDETATEDNEPRQGFAEWMQAEVVAPVMMEAPKRPPPPDEDPRSLLAELMPPAWLTTPELAEAIDDIPALMADVKTMGKPTLTGSQPLRNSSRSSHNAQDATAKAGKADKAEPQMFELEVEYEPPPAAKRGLKPAAGLMGTTAESAASTNAASTPSASSATPEAQAVKAPSAPALPPEVELREYVPTLKTVRVTVDKGLSLEVSPSDGEDGVKVRVDGTPEALRELVNIESELRDELPESGYSLDEFSSHEREGEADGSGEGDAVSEADEAEARTVATHDGMINEIA